MNVDPRCRQPITRANLGALLPINFVVAVCLASSLLILLAGPEFLSL